MKGNICIILGILVLAVSCNYAEEGDICRGQVTVANETITSKYKEKFCSACEFRCNEADSNETDLEDVGESRQVDPLSLKEPPQWLVGYMGPFNEYLPEGRHYGGIITRVSDSVFLAHWETIARVDNPPNGCTQGKMTLFSKSRLFGTTAQVPMTLDWDRITRGYEATQLRTYVGKEALSMGLNRVYFFHWAVIRSRLTNANLRHYTRHTPPNIGRLIDVPEIQSDKNTHNYCFMYAFKGKLYDGAWDFTVMPVTVMEELTWRTKKLYMSDHQHEHCRTDNGSPIVCDGKLTFLSFHNSASECSRYFGGTILAVYRNKINQAIANIRPRFDYDDE